MQTVLAYGATKDNSLIQFPNRIIHWKIDR